MPVTVNVDAEVMDMTWPQAMVHMQKIVEDCERKCNSGAASRVRDRLLDHFAASDALTRFNMRGYFFCV